MRFIDAGKTKRIRGSTLPRFFAFVLGFFGVVEADFGLAADIDFNISLSEIYSSNINLQTEELAESDFITRISPELSWTHEGKGSEVHLDYVYEALFYADRSDFNEDFHQLASDARVDLIGEELQLAGRAAYAQVNVSPNKPLADSNISTTGNRSNAFSWGVGPYWQRELPLNSEIDAYYDFGRIDYDNPESQDIDTQTFGLTMATNRDTSTSLTYDLEYDYWFLDYQTLGDIRDQQLTLTLSQEMSRNFYLDGLVGLDSDLADQQSNSLSEGRWEVGFTYADIGRKFSAAIGERYFGTTFRLSASQTISDWQFTASYSENPGTAESIYLGELPQGADDDAPPQPPASGLDQPGSGTRFLQKRADGVVQWEGDRSRFNLLVWWDERDSLSGSIENPNPQTRDDTIGAEISYAWEAGSRTTTNFSASWASRDFTDVDTANSDTFTAFQDETWRINGNVYYRLGLKTTLGSEVGFVSSTGNDYDEFRATIDITRSF